MNGINLRYSQGRSLVELMISMTIGLIISLAVTSLFVNNSKTYKVFDDKSVMEENGRMALNMIAYHVRMAHTAPTKNTSNQAESGGGVSTYDTALFGDAIFGCSGGFLSPVAVPAACNPATTGPDSLLIRYVVDIDNANAAAASLAAPTDCLGQMVPSGPENFTVENRYYIASNPATNQRELYCAGNGGVPLGAPLQAGRPIMENVVDMKIIYGYDPNYTKSVNSFYSAVDLASPTVPEPNEALRYPLPLDPSDKDSKWSRVISAKICMVMRSGNDGLTPKPMTYTNCSGSVVTATDKRLYSTFSTVVGIRGRLPGRTL
ncbi:PilW family protein [Undibacterium umbellatum]|uniref:PilW family protein n=1 Tax=Undibacterium umbellatum TaxID=2762300 RepID=A0ABR6ZI53_9BURK|nr:PilW family protein [Undibacterium umbellatum]MBC3911368.1 PilW family protein [Undibacterium umbellatum]